MSCKRKTDVVPDQKKAKETVTKAKPDDLSKIKPDPPPPPITLSELSEKKLTEITRLRAELAQKKSHLVATKEKFSTEIAACISEIKNEQVRANLTDYASATKNRLITNNLQAISKARAYQDIVDHEIQLTHDGDLELHGLSKQLNIDKIMLNSLEQEKLTVIIAKLDLTINTIQPKAKELVINPSNTKLPPLEDVWREYIENPNSGADAMQPAPSTAAIASEDSPRLTYRRRCKSTDIDSECVSCLAAGNQRCYIRVPFTPTNSDLQKIFSKALLEQDSIPELFINDLIK